MWWWIGGGCAAVAIALGVALYALSDFREMTSKHSDDRC